ncbi:MAG: AAA family ATPase [Planctomycetes bacterium]|nr:AAA family ATPase [Planctomycetota bacterium]
MTELTEERISALRSKARELRDAIESRYVDQRAATDDLLHGLLAGGHVLLEGAPGLGKTTLVRTVASCLGLDFRRLQCTPDLMPADVLGMRILEEDPNGGHRFHFERGPVFTQVLLTDEINRATPRTQSALLEAMQERQVTVFGETLPLDRPFFVAATQNPIEMEGTYPLPEAQLDRFLLRVDVESPTAEGIVKILETERAASTPLDPVLSGDEVLELQALTASIPASSDILALAAQTIIATHPENEAAPELVRRHVRFGASPRGAQALLGAARARALLAGQLHVREEDLEAVVQPCLRHRLMLTYEGEAAGVSTGELAQEAYARAQS